MCTSSDKIMNNVKIQTTMNNLRFALNLKLEGHFFLLGSLKALLSYPHHP